METRLVRLKRHDPRRGFVLRRYTYAGIKFQEDRGWVRVEAAVGEYLKSARQAQEDPHSPLAFDVCTDEEARALDTAEADAAKGRRSATDDLKVIPARTGVAQDAPPPPAVNAVERGTPRAKRE